MLCYKAPKQLEKKDIGHPNPKIGPPVSDPSNIFKHSTLKDQSIQKFKEGFMQETSQVNDKMAKQIEKIETADCLATVEAIPEVNCQYWSLRDLFYEKNKESQQSDEISEIIKNLSYPFKALQRSKKAERKLLLCVNEYLERLKAELSHEPIALQEDPIFRSTLSNLQPILNKKFEDVIELVRKRQQQRMRAIEKEKYIDRMVAVTQELPKDTMIEEQRKVNGNINSSEKQVQEELIEQNEQIQQQLKEEAPKQQQVKSLIREETNDNEGFVDNNARERQCLEYQITQLQSQNRQLQALKIEYETVNAKLNEELTKLSQSYDSLRIEYVSLEKESSELVDANSLLAEKVSKLQQQRQQLLRVVQVLNEKYEKYEGKRLITYSQLDLRVLFHGNILAARAGEKQFLIGSINHHMMGKISKTDLLYTFSRDKKTNFHEFIDKHSNIVLVIETKDALIAAYYSGELSTTEVMEEQTLILSLDRRKAFKLNNSRNYPNQVRDPRETRALRGMTYDPYYLIFGNAELRVRAGESKVFSNLGINNSYFNSEGSRAKDLFNVNQNEVEFIDYQIYQAEFYDEVDVRQ